MQTNKNINEQCVQNLQTLLYLHVKNTEKIFHYQKNIGNVSQTEHDTVCTALSLAS